MRSRLDVQWVKSRVFGCGGAGSVGLEKGDRGIDGEGAVVEVSATGDGRRGDIARG